MAVRKDACTTHNISVKIATAPREVSGRKRTDEEVRKQLRRLYEGKLPRSLAAKQENLPLWLATLEIER